jgi:hypothetical protein
MEMFLMLAAMSFLGIIVTLGLFATAMGSGRERAEVRIEQAMPATPPQFFLDVRSPAAPRVPLEVLLLQIERHVRLEQAAAESFIDAPTAKSLHSRTMSPLMH